VVTLLGLAFRGGVSDTRLSPTYDVISEFQKRGVREIRIHDPLVRSDPELLKRRNVILSSNLDAAVSGADLVMIVADHPEYRSLTSDQLGGLPVYDGRAILDTTIFDYSPYAAIGVGNTSYGYGQNG
jgi:UDP-N-acetyl-D-mannosaminuronate dehydrogenase